MADVMRKGRKGKKDREKSSCRGKQRMSQDMAYCVLRKKRVRGCINMHVYSCRYCNGWHVGHMLYGDKR